MATLQADDIADLIKATQRELGKLKFTEAASDIQDHIAFSQLLRKESVKFGSGYGIQFNFMHQHSGAAKWVGLYEVDDVNVGDVLVQGDLPWRHITTNRGIDMREVSMNQMPAKIVDMVQLNRVDSVISMADKFEQRFWRKPAGTTDKVNPFGVLYWLVYNATEGFNGGNETDFSSGPANISATTYSRWKNWTAKYVSVTKTDLIRKMRKGSTFTGFRSPINVPTYQRGNPLRFGYYTTYAVVGVMEELLESQNENLGNDLASKDGQVMFRQNPVTWVPELENLAAGNPIIGLNWSTFYVSVLNGWLMRETGPKPSPTQHTVVVNHTDTSCNIVCKDRRRNMLIATADPTES